MSNFFRNKKNLPVILLVVVTIIVVVCSIVFGKDTKSKENIKIVTDASKFYTVNSCIYRFSTYLADNDVDSVYKIVDENFINDNNITKQNILDNFYEILPDYTFISKKMYSSIVNENITKYYVYGVYQPNSLFDDTDIYEVESTDAYYIVYLDNSKSIFSIEPYNGDIFKSGDK